MGKFNEHYKNKKKEKKVNFLEFGKKKYPVKDNYTLFEYIMMRQDEINKKAEAEEKRIEDFEIAEDKRLEKYVAEHGTDEGFEPKTYYPQYNHGYENMKMMINFLKNAVSDEFVEDIQDLTFDEVSLLFSVVINMVQGLDEDAAFEEAIKKKN